MRALIALDKFKDALSAREACAVVDEALGAAQPGGARDVCPLTDGGEGFAEILTAAAGGRCEVRAVADARGHRVEAKLGFVAWRQVPIAARRLLALGTLRENDLLGVVGMAEASGLALLPAGLRDPWQTASVGTGELLRRAADAGVKAIVLGVGGSATHDLGFGALAALGWQFYRNAVDTVAAPSPATWPQIVAIVPPTGGRLPPIRIACDVQNPLVGERGAARVYAPQKGCRAEDVAALEAGTLRMAEMLAEAAQAPTDLWLRPGMGAAGGMAYGLAAATGALLVPGAELVSAWLALDARIDAADIVLTGEGRFDASSLEGKGPGALVAQARARGKAVHFFAGAVAIAAPVGVTLHVITPTGQRMPEALAACRENLGAAVQAAFAPALVSGCGRG